MVSFLVHFNICLTYSHVWRHSALWADRGSRALKARVFISGADSHLLALEVGLVETIVFSIDQQILNVSESLSLALTVFI